MDKISNLAQITAAKYESRIPFLSEGIETSNFGAIRAFSDEDGLMFGRCISNLASFSLDLDGAQQVITQVRFVGAQYPLLKTSRVVPSQELRDAVSTLNVLSFTPNGQDLQKIMEGVRKVITPDKSIVVPHSVRHFFGVDPIEVDDMIGIVQRMATENSWDLSRCMTLLDSFDPRLSNRLSQMVVVQ